MIICSGNKTHIDDYPPRTQFVFNLTTVEAFTKGRGFKASSGITGPLRDSSIADLGSHTT